MQSYNYPESSLSILDKVRKSVAELEQRVAEFEQRMNYKAQPLSEDAQDRLDTKFHYSNQMRRWVE